MGDGDEEEGRSQGQRGGQGRGTAAEEKGSAGRSRKNMVEKKNEDSNIEGAGTPTAKSQTKQAVPMRYSPGMSTPRDNVHIYILKMGHF
eukprot:jgi/Bigna1/126532/aug1.2_g1240